MEEEVSKKHYTKIVLITIIAVVLVVIIAFIVYVWQTTGAPPIEIVKSFLGNSHNPNPDTNSNPENIDSNPDNPSAGSSGGGGGGGGSESSSGSLPVCYTKEVSSSIEKITKETKCLQPSGSDCLEQEINCTAEIHNYDSQVSGDFEVKINFIDRSNGSQIVNSKIDYFSIEAQNFSLMQEIYSLEGQNPNLDCSFNTLKVPSTEICS